MIEVVIRKTDVRCLSVWRVTNVAMHNGTNHAYHKLLLNPRHWALSGRGATQVHPVPKTQKFRHVALARDLRNDRAVTKTQTKHGTVAKQRLSGGTTGCASDA